MTTVRLLVYFVYGKKVAAVVKLLGVYRTMHMQVYATTNAAA